MGSMDLTVSLSAGLRITPAQVTLMTHTTDSASCPASAFNVTCDTSVNKSSHIVSEAPHLMTLWDRRRLAQAGNLDTLPRDNSRPQCEFIHCACKVCQLFRTNKGDWKDSQCTKMVGYKCVQCRVCFDSSGHWCVQRESVKGCTGSTCEGLGSGNLIPFTSIMTTAQHSDLLPTCRTQVQLSVHQMAHKRKRIRRALDRRWQSRHEPFVVPDTLLEPTTTQVQLSSQNMVNEQRRTRSRAALAMWKPSANLVPVTGQILQASPTRSHIPSMFATMVCTAVAHGSEWAKARVLVDSGSEHPPLISQNMADKLGLAGPISGEGT